MLQVTWVTIKAYVTQLTIKAYVTGWPLRPILLRWPLRPIYVTQVTIKAYVTQVTIKAYGSPLSCVFLQYSDCNVWCIYCTSSPNVLQKSLFYIFFKFCLRNELFLLFTYLSRLIWWIEQRTQINFLLGVKRKHDGIEFIMMDEQQLNLSKSSGRHIISFCLYIKTLMVSLKLFKFLYIKFCMPKFFLTIS